MENIRSASALLCFSVGIFLLLLNHANAEDRMFPWKNANLSPFQQWRSAYFCLNDIITNDECGPKDTLKFGGWLSFENSTEVEGFCGGPCFNQTLSVIHCIELVHRHFIFQSGAPLSFVKDKITSACSSPNKQGFNTSYPLKPNSATSLHGRLHLPLISAMALIIATFFTY